MNEYSAKELLEAVKELVPEFSPTGNCERLSGGNINYVWRIGGKPHNLIAKHAPSHIATNPDVPLSNERIDFEARALSLFTSEGRLQNLATQEIRPPKMIAFDPVRSLLIMEDVGEFTELTKADSHVFSSGKTGERLGQFIGNLHRSTFGDEELRNSFQNRGIQKVRNQLQYRPAHEYADLADKVTEAKLKNRSQDLGNRLQQQRGTCLTMGDLWPPSLFVNESADIRLIDWEFVHFGRPLQDVGHFAAHCWMHQHVLENGTGSDWWRSLWTSFWNAYKKAIGTDVDRLFNADEKKNIGIHIGTEILVRAFGPFKEGYVFEPFADDHPVLNEAKHRATEFILKPQSAPDHFNL